MEANANYQALSNAPVARAPQDSRQSPSGLHTPVLRRSQIETYTRSTNHENLVQSCEFTLAYEAVALAYLTVCLVFIKDLNAACGFNVKHHTQTFLKIVLWPTLLFRFVGYLRYKNVSYA